MSRNDWEKRLPRTALNRVAIGLWFTKMAQTWQDTGKLAQPLAKVHSCIAQFADIKISLYPCDDMHPAPADEEE